MSKITIVLLVILAVLLIALVVLYFLGKKAQKKQAEQEEMIAAAAQQVNILVIDKGKMKLKDAGRISARRKLCGDSVPCVIWMDSFLFSL